jgi:glutamate synthase domain-containing protein 2/glutamate synthase domain-containing protein 1/glutamate synthase domain-containing protein 3
MAAEFHDACGLGAVVRLDGERTHALIEQALEVLENLDHRGATGSDPETGDGAGILSQLPDAFFRRVAREDVGVELGAAGDYAVGTVFLPRRSALRLRCEELFVRICAEEGHRALGWRDVPVCSDRIGTLARGSEPVVRQLLVERREGDAEAFERKLFVIRRRVEKATAAAGVPDADFSIVSLSSRVVVYKGLLRARQLRGYYPDLAAPDFAACLAVVHSRFSTNTLGTWDLAHPFNLIAHNGEINTVRGNANWLHAREPQLRSPLFGGDLQKVFPIAEERWSDSAKLDAALELLVHGGRSLPHALAMLVPPAWTDPTLDLPDDVRAFHEYHASLIEPWDGPAAIVASDGTQVVACLDRNGLRPARFLRTRDDVVVLASEVGVLDVDPADVVEAGRLEPGRMLVLDTASGRVVRDAEVKRVLARRRPYRRWLDEQKLFLDDQRPQSVEPLDPDDLSRLQRAFGYTHEDLRQLIAPMARDGAEPVGSMGDDTPLAALSERPKLLPSYFKQHFAQVTNPPIDPQREALVMSLRTTVGAIRNLLDETPAHCHRVAMPTPILQSGDLAKLRALPRDRFRAATLKTLYPVADGAAGLEQALDELCREASKRVWDGHEILILSDRGVDRELAPISPLLATAAVHSHLVREGARTMCGLVVESGEPREAMHFALLIGYGAAAVNPYLALESLRALHASGDLGDVSFGTARERYVQAVCKALLKICSKMGISTIQSYRGAQIFEAIGLGRSFVQHYFPGTTSRVGGLELHDLHEEAAERHAAAFPPRPLPEPPELDPGGEYQLRRRGEHHTWNPGTIVPLQRAVRDAAPASFAEYAEAIDGAAAQLQTLRGLLELVPAAEPVPLDEVESSSEIVKRFATGAMSLGSLSPEAHETLAIAMNRLGGRSNTGEGGEDPRRSIRDANGDLRRSAIKQVASARFGVTARYLVDADQLQIKVAQGAKPGEGGQLPGHKVDETIARLRHATPGVGLISPPPHHDIYSIEDLAQLIHDLKSVNPHAEISVKLVAEAGVGTVAAGVAKAKAEHVVIAGHDGGTGASPLSSLKHAGLPWELGLAEAHQVLVSNGLRRRVRLQVDGGLRTGRDVVVGALLGAEEFAFSTAPLVALGCVMMRVCHLNTCPVGIATQDPELRRRFAGTPEHAVRYFLFVAEQVRELMATLGVRRFDDLVGRVDLARCADTARWSWLHALDLQPLLAPAADALAAGPPVRGEPQDHALDVAVDHEWLPLVARAAAGEAVVASRRIRNTDRSPGAMLAGEIARQAPDGLRGTITLKLRGAGGQSLGAFAPAGLTIDLEGLCNDYAGKGLSGGTLVVRPPRASSYAAAEQVVVGNVVLYGATGGDAYLSGQAGERFAVRNSGANAVVEGVGDHGCEYMTGGCVVVLGAVGRNFAAGMSGGIAFLLADDALARRVNRDTVALEPVEDPEDAALLVRLVAAHRLRTGSEVAARLLADEERLPERFVKVMPHDLRRVFETRSAEPDALEVTP